MSLTKSPTADEEKVSKLEVLIGSRNERGIPAALFVDDIGAFIVEKTLELDDVLQRQHELLSKYKFMETHMQKNKVGRRAALRCVGAKFVFAIATVAAACAAPHSSPRSARRSRGRAPRPLRQTNSLFCSCAPCVSALSRTFQSSCPISKRRCRR